MPRFLVCTTQAAASTKAGATMQPVRICVRSTRANFVAMRGQAGKVSRDAVLQAFKSVAQQVADDEVIQQCQRLCEDRALSPHDLACKWQAHVDEVWHRRPVLAHTRVMRHLSVCMLVDAVRVLAWITHSKGVAPAVYARGSFLTSVCVSVV